MRWEARGTAGSFWVLAVSDVEGFTEGSLCVVAWRKNYDVGQTTLI